MAATPSRTYISPPHLSKGVYLVTFAGFELSDEVRMLKDNIVRFVQRDIVPAEQDLDSQGEIRPEAMQKLQERAKSQGLWMLQLPEHLGGAGLTTFESVVTLEAAVKHRTSLPYSAAFGRPPSNLLWDGTEYQIERYVKPIVESGIQTFTAISEPSGGSDPARAIRTTARRQGDHYVLRGEKLWVTGASNAPYGIVFARTSEGRGGISAFILDADSPGITRRNIAVIRDHGTTSLMLDDVRVPAENLIGEEGQGFQLAQKWLVAGRLSIAASCIGVAQEALRMVSDWVRQRETFGALLATRQAVQFSIADSEMELRAARYFTWDAAWDHDAGLDARVKASMAKLSATETACRVLDRCMQLFGGLGLSRELPIEGWYRAVRVWRVGEGASEIQRHLIARDILGDSVH